MKLITKNVPTHLKPAVAMGVFPALGAHCKGVKFRYNDNALVEPTFMNILVAEMSSGKSAVNKPIDAIMAEGEKQGIKPTDEAELEKTLPYLKMQLKALVARDIWDMSEYFSVVNERSEMVKKALEVIMK